MAFETLHLIPDSPVDVERVRAWFDDKPWAFADPHGQPVVHVSATAGNARRALEQRKGDDSVYPRGVVIEIRADGLTLEALADAPVFARVRSFLSWLVEGGGWRMRVDFSPEEPADLTRVFPNALPELSILVDDPLGRPVVAGRVISWSQGDPEVDGSWRLEVHTSGALHYVRWGGPTRQGALDPLARLRWLEAAAHLDEDDDELVEAIPQTRVVRIGVDEPDDEWTLYMDAEALSPSAVPLGAVVAAWRPRLEGWDGPGLPPDLAGLLD